jgi:M6 family metalloprotease-like protein
MVKPRLALGYSILLTVILFSTFISSSLALGPRVEASAGLSYHLAPPLVKPSQAPELSPTVVSATREGKAAGPISVIALLVEFKNLNHTLSREEVKDKVISKVSEYYREASNGLAWVVGDVAGWYKLSQTVSYYGRDGRMVDDPNFDGVIDSWWLIRDAVAAADPDVDFAQYDYVVVVHAGYGQESSRVSDDLWSVAYWGGVWVKTNDGKSVYGGVIAPELEDRGADPFGVYCHELAHLVGLPDLYGEGGAKNWVDRWSLMDRGLWNGDPPGSSPAHPDAWSKLKLAWASGSQVAQVNASLKMNLTLTTTGSQEGEYRVMKVPVDQYRYYLVG